MTDHDDSDLAAQFAALRSTEDPRTPPFERVVRGRTRRLSSMGARVVYAALAAALIAIVFSRFRESALPSARPPLAFAAGSLRMPTDFLLDQAASLQTAAMPAIGAVDWSPLDTVDASSSTITRRRN